MNFPFGKKQEPDTVDVPAPAPEAAPATEAVPAPEQITDPAASPQDGHPATDPVDLNLAAQEWDQQVPDLAGLHATLSPEQRTQVLYARIQANQTVAKPSEAESPSPPPIREVPTLDKSAAQVEWARLIRDGDDEGAAMVQAKIAEYDEALVGAVYDSSLLAQFNADQNAIAIAAVQRPNEIRAAGAHVQGFLEADVVAAASLLDSGKIQDIGSAVQMVVLQRQAIALTAAPVPLTAQQKAATAAAAALAASAPGGQANSAAGNVPIKDFSSPEGRALIARSMGLPE